MCEDCEDIWMARQKINSVSGTTSRFVCFFGNVGHEPTAYPEAKPQIVHLMETLTREAQGVPAVQHLAPRRTKPGSLDLTASTMFVNDIEKHAHICEHARKLAKHVTFRKTSLSLATVLEMFFKALHTAHSLWSQKTMLTQNDLDQAGLVGGRRVSLVQLNAV